MIDPPIIITKRIYSNVLFPKKVKLTINQILYMEKSTLILPVLFAVVLIILELLFSKYVWISVRPIKLNIKKKITATKTCNRCIPDQHVTS
jgi:hypothetical protein